MGNGGPSEYVNIKIRHADGSVGDLENYVSSRKWESTWETDAVERSWVDHMNDTLRDGYLGGHPDQFHAVSLGEEATPGQLLSCVV